MSTILLFTTCYGSNITLEVKIISNAWIIRNLQFCHDLRIEKIVTKFACCALNIFEKLLMQKLKTKRRRKRVEL